jgi:hypothetical protein
VPEFFKYNIAMMRINESDPSVVHLGTEVGSWAIFHPQDLQSKKDHPQTWWEEDRQVVPFFRSGSLIMMDTGADGGFVLLLTFKKPEGRWLRGASDPCEFRLNVAHGRVFCGNPTVFPCDVFELYADELKRDENWLELPNGNYRVLVWRLDFGKMGVDADYLVQFSRVDTLGEVGCPRFIPQLWPKDRNNDGEPVWLVPDSKASESKSGSTALPLLPMRELALPEREAITLFVGRPSAVAAIEAALERFQGKLAVFQQKDPMCLDPDLNDLESLGSAASILHSERLSDGSLKIVIQAEKRIQLTEIEKAGQVAMVHFCAA